jgi:predicted Rossmann-fold nucleotide-binding protein
MEAVSKGAREALREEDRTPASPQVVGVLVPGQFPDRALVGNRYLTESVDAEHMNHRIHLLSSRSRYYVVLPGTLGTLQEFVTIWTMGFLQPAALPKPVIVLFRDPWEKLVDAVVSILNLGREQKDLCRFADTPEEAMNIIVQDDARQRSTQP